MKLLFDQNLSHRLVKAFADEFPGSVHVRHVGLEKASDGPVWDYAKENGFVIVSKDSDFHQRSFLYGHPPKVVWIQRGTAQRRLSSQYFASTKMIWTSSHKANRALFWRCSDQPPNKIAADEERST